MPAASVSNDSLLYSRTILHWYVICLAVLYTTSLPIVRTVWLMHLSVSLCVCVCVCGS